MIYRYASQDDIDDAVLPFDVVDDVVLPFDVVDDVVLSFDVVDDVVLSLLHDATKEYPSC